MFQRIRHLISSRCIQKIKFPNYKRWFLANVHQKIFQSAYVHPNPQRNIEHKFQIHSVSLKKKAFHTIHFLNYHLKLTSKLKKKTGQLIIPHQFSILINSTKNCTHKHVQPQALQDSQHQVSLARRKKRQRENVNWNSLAITVSTSGGGISAHVSPRAAITLGSRGARAMTNGRKTSFSCARRRQPPKAFPVL